MYYNKITNIQIAGVNWNDYPDFANAYILSADYDGVPMTEKQLDELNNDGYFVTILFGKL
jgi:hypothetical protein